MHPALQPTRALRFGRGPDRSAARQLARLQFALVVVACGVIAGLALDELVQLKQRGEAASQAIQLAQERTSAALMQALCASGIASNTDAEKAVAATEFPNHRRAPSGNPSGTSPSCP